MSRYCFLFVLLFSAISSAQDVEAPLAAPAEAEQTSHLVEPILQAGHSDSVYYAAFTPDERYLLSAGDDQKAILWDVATGEKVREFPCGHRDIALSPDGKIVFTARNTYRASRRVGVFLDVQTGEKIGECTAETDCERVWSPRFDPTGQYLVTCHGQDEKDVDPTVRLWEVNTGKLVREFKGHEKCVQVAAFSGKEDLLATGDDRGVVIIWNWKTGETVKILKEHQNAEYPAICSLAFSPDGKELVTGVIGATCFLEVRTWILLETLKHYSVGGTAYAPDGSAILIPNESLRIYDPLTKAMRDIVRGHNSSIHHTVFSPGGSLMATASGDSTVMIWDAASKKPIKRFGIPKGGSMEYRSCISPDNKQIAVGTARGNILFYETETGHLFRKLELN